MEDIERNQLNKVIGITKSFKGENLTITKFREVDDVVTIFATQRNLNLTYPDELQEFLRLLADPVSTVPAVTGGQDGVVANGYQPSEENKVIKETLMDALKRVQGEPGYIPQAKSIIEISQAMINIQKTEMEFIKLTSKR